MQRQTTNKTLATTFFAMLIASILLTNTAYAECNFFTGWVDNKDGTVRDPRNGLIWKRCAEGFEFANGICTGNGSQANWRDAMSLAQQSRFLGQSDWRLPTKEEFAAVVGPSIECNRNDWKNGEYAASKAIAHSGDYFWSSSPDVDDTANAWRVLFNQGYRSSDFYRFPSYYRLVRASQLLGGEAALEFVKERADRIAAAELRRLAEERQRAAEERQRAAEEARQRQEEQNRERKVAAFRKSLKEGDDTSSGVVIQVKGNLVKIQTNESQCTQRNYDGICTNYINTPAEKWFKRSEVYPQ